MTYEKIKFEIKGVSPLLMHNGALLDPFDPYTQALAELTSQQKKTLETYQMISQAEWRASLYTAERQSETGPIIIPAMNLEAMIADAATDVKKKKKAQAGILVEEDAILRFPGEKRSIADLQSDPNFTLRVRASLRGNGVMRTRPRFAEWSLSFIVSYLPGEAGEKDVRRWVAIAGGKGLGDWTPKYGRFVVAVDGVPA